MNLSRRGLTTLRVVQCGALLVLVAYVAQAATGFCANILATPFENWVYPGLILTAAGLCIARGLTERAERAAWLFLGAGIAAWAVGELYWTLFLDTAEEPPAFTPADGLWLAFYPACLIALALLVRARVRRLNRGLALDGVIGALALSAIGAAFVYGTIVGAYSGTPDLPADLAFFFSDLVLIGFVVSCFAITGWRPGLAISLLGAGLAVGAAVDGFFLWNDASGTYMSTTVVAALWPVSALLAAFAAWVRPAPPLRFVRMEGWRAIALPAGFALAALGVIAARAFTNVNGLAIALAVATLATVIVRMALALSEHMRLLVVSRGEALTDSLTGLANRRKLMLDLDQRIEACADGDSCALLLFDLDGFKQYNDWHGHPAGDALLRRLGERLVDAIGDTGECYRLGGDEFCVIAPGGELQARRLRAVASEALSERGEGFDIGTSVGLVMMPRDASSAASVLQLADERLYSQKARRRRFSVGRQTSKALVQALEEREPQMRNRIFDVAQLAREVSAQLGLKGEHLEQVVRAAELHDVGRVAVPDAILHKSGPLDEEEWANMREHALAGDRILSAAPALEAIAKLVRASHERYDGHGYPDKLAGEDIPLGARIVAACDAFNAMTSDRPHKQAMSRDDAVDELRRCSGAQFDPAVVEVLADVVSRRPERVQAAFEDMTLGAGLPAPTDAA